jgi:energy-coupling factor transport system ATP-binding protein
MAMRPEVIVFDEPAAGLDPKGRRAVFDIIRKYSRNTGCTVIVVSHSMEDMAGIADRLIVMNRGSLFCHCPVNEVFSMAEELTGMGLDVPQVTKVFSELKKRGLVEDDNVYTVGQAADSIMKCLGRKGGDPAC